MVFRRAPDYLGLLRELAALEPPMFVFGSVAEAALLEGALRSSHGDLDVLITRGELESRLEQLAGLGFTPFVVLYEPRPGLPLVIRGSRDGVVLELSLLDRDRAGNPYFAVRAAEGVVAVWLPRDLFAWPPTIVDGVPVHTVSPLALVQMRAAATATGAFGAARPDKDVARQAALVQAFFPGVDPADLEPQLTVIGRDGADRPSVDGSGAARSGAPSSS